MLAKLFSVLRESGVSGTLVRASGYIYRRRIRSLLPVVRPVLYGGLPVSYDVRWGDRFLAGAFRARESVDQPNYEASLTAGLRQYVRPGDTVIVVGGGAGVTATVAAQCTGASGRVDCYEASLSGVDEVLETARRNAVSGVLHVHHAVVGEAIDIWGEGVAETVVPPESLPDCDVLELDCEGAEAGIIRDMVILPRVCLVETHGVFGSPTALVAALLTQKGYDVVDIGTEERESPWCRENDISVLAAVRG